MAKFKVGQLVVIARPKYYTEDRGKVGEVIGLPGCDHDLPNEYELYMPHIDGRMFADEYVLDPIDDTDHRTKADEDELKFNPKKEFNH